MSSIKGMVVVAGKTYRVVKLKKDEYEVYRILDDIYVGKFGSGNDLPIAAAKGVEPELIKQVAMAALKIGKITWRRRTGSQ